MGDRSRVLEGRSSWQDGNQTQISGYQAPDGWVYIVADGFARDHGVWLYHCPAENFTDRNTWWAWGIGRRQLGLGCGPDTSERRHLGRVKPALDRRQGGVVRVQWSTGNVEVRVADDVTQVLAPETPVTVVATQETFRKTTAATSFPAPPWTRRSFW